MKLREFLKNLSDLYPRSSDPDKLKLYRSKMNQWALTDEELDKIYELASENPFFPTLHDLRNCLNVVRKPLSAQWLTWSMGNLRYCRKLDDPRYLPELPEKAAHRHLVIPPEKLADYETCSIPEGKKIFEREFRAVYPDPPAEVLNRYFGIVRGKQ